MTKWKTLAAPVTELEHPCSEVPFVAGYDLQGPTSISELEVAAIAAAIQSISIDSASEVPNSWRLAARLEAISQRL